MNISDKMFIILIILLVGWLVLIVAQKPYNLDSNAVNNVGNAFLFVLGTMLGAYIQKGETNRTRSKKK